MVYQLSDFHRCEVDQAVGRNGLKDVTVVRRALFRASTETVCLLPRKRRIGKLGPAKVLEFRR